MAKIEGTCREVLEKSEWIAIATSDAGGPHVVGTWSSYIMALSVGRDDILIPVAGYHITEQQLAKSNRIELLCATKAVQGTYGPGKGCCIRGTGQILTSGELAEKTKKLFDWARGVLVITVEEAIEQL